MNYGRAPDPRFSARAQGRPRLHVGGTSKRLANKSLTFGSRAGLPRGAPIHTTWRTDSVPRRFDELGLGRRIDVSSKALRRSADDARQGPQLPWS